MKVLAVGFAVIGVTASAFSVEVEYAGADPAVKFAVKDAETCLAGAKGRIVLSADPSLESQAWRIRTAADGSLVISGRDGMGIV